MNGTAPEHIDILRQGLADQARSILNLTARNPLINLRSPGAKAIRIADELPDEIASDLFAGKRFSFKPIEEAPGFTEDPPFELPIELPMPTTGDQAAHHRDRYLQTDIPRQRLTTRLKGIESHNRSELQERGVSTLFLALGALQYHKAIQPDKEQLAPLFLIPVQLNKNRGPSGLTFDLEALGSAAKRNQCLSMLLEQDFDLALPPLDDEDINPEAYFALIEDAIKEWKQPWRVARTARLAFFNYSGLVIQDDLNPDKWPTCEESGCSSLLSNANVRLALLGEHQEQLDSGEPPTEYDIDSHPVGSKLQTPLQSDSSQLSAIIDVLKEKSLLIEGPPGTGKSQTIANLIAMAMAEGKRVLFVAEKPAALDVVHKRLRAMGFDPYTLYLHSSNTKLSDVYAKLGQRLEMRSTPVAANQLQQSSEDLAREQRTISEYLDSLHTPLEPLDISLHDLIWEASQRLDMGALVTAISDGQAPPSRNSHTARLALFDTLHQALRDADLATVGHWAGIDAGDFSNANRILIDQHCQTIEQCMSTVSTHSSAISNQCSIPQQAVEQIAESAISSLSTVAQSAPPELEEAVAQACIPNYSLSAAKTIAKAIDCLATAPPTDEAMSAEIAVQLLEAASGTHLHATASLPSVRKFATLITRFQQTSNATRQLRQQLANLGMPSESTVSTALRFAQAVGLAEQLTNNNVANLTDAHLTKQALKQWSTQLLHAADLARSRRDLASIYDFKSVPTPAELDKLAAESSALTVKPLKFLRPAWYRLRRHVGTFTPTPKPTAAAVFGSSLRNLSEHLTEWEQWHAVNAAESPPLSVSPADPSSIDQAKSVLKLLKGLAKLADAGCFDPTAFYQAYAAEQHLPQADALIKTLNQFAGAIASYAAQTAQKLDEKAILKLQWREIDATEKAAIALQSAMAAAVFASPNLIEGGVNAVLDACRAIVAIKNANTLVMPWGLELPEHPCADAQSQLQLVSDALSLAERLSEIQNLPNAIVSSCLRMNPLAQLSALSEELSTMAKARHTANSAHRDALDLLGSTSLPENIDGNAATASTFARLHRDHGAALPAWSHLCRLQRGATEAGISHWFELAIQGSRTATETKDDYEVSVMSWIVSKTLSESPQFRTVTGDQLNAARERFRDLDSQIRDLSMALLASKSHAAHAQVEAGQNHPRVGQKTERYLIEHESRKTRAYLKIRPLFERASRALLQLQPCLMMNPTTVAETLPKRADLFDLVVFDEASQVKPANAFGALARARHFVVVGDPKQLPPTNFFARNYQIDTDEPDDELATSDAESILEVLQRTMPRSRYRRLRWHYRSAHESLIAFSNQRWYENDLIVFPAPSRSAGKLGVSLTYVKDASFDSGRNMTEAMAVAKAIVDHARTYRDESDPPSLGVAAMNRKQADLISELLDKLCFEDADARKLVRSLEEHDEPLFIKNLENVQGDERDVILISFTYGPAPGTRATPQRFGPINMAGGWRRLNVLITRARLRVQVFSSMQSTDIIAGPTTSEGAVAMKHYLAYAETGTLVEQGDVGGDREPDSPFEVSVASCLRRFGFNAVPQVGVSGYFIDIGVQLDGQQDFILGVECDGATYHSSKSARDRDAIRQEVIESKGWTIHRIWSTDWFTNREYTEARLRDAVQRAEETTPPHLRSATTHVEADRSRT